MQEAFLTTRRASQALGVSEASLKRWCDQGLLPVVRTPGGHRRLPVSGLVQFARERRLEFVQPGIIGLPRALVRNEDVRGGMHEALGAALQSGDEQEVRALILGRYLGGRSAAEILDETFAPAFREMGDKWAHGDLEVFEERRAVELAMRLLHQWRMLLPIPPSAAPLAIGGTLGGDPYTLPTTMVELALRESGWRAESYGCGLPPSTLVDAIRRVRPRLLWLSVSAFESEAQFAEDYLRIYEAARELGVAVIIGGRMLTPQLRERLRYSAFCDNLRHGVAFVGALDCRGTVEGEERS